MMQSSLVTLPLNQSEPMEILMNIIRVLSTTILILVGLSGCSAHRELKAPCPDFGRYCAQTPINSTNEPPTNL